MVKKRTDQLNKALQLVQEEEEKEAQHSTEKSTSQRQKKVRKSASHERTLDLSSNESSLSSDEMDGGARVDQTNRHDDSDVGDK